MRSILIFVICLCMTDSRADDRFYIAAKVNGRPALFIFDTGADRPILWSNCGVRLGLTNLIGGDE